MELDLTARRTLELTETLRGKEKKGSLLWVLDKTRTAMGHRLIRAWLEQPLLSPVAINRRLSAVKDLTGIPSPGRRSPVLRGDHRPGASYRRIVYGTAGGRGPGRPRRRAGKLPPCGSCWRPFSPPC